MIDPDTFRSVLGRFASGVTIITARDKAGQDHGMTVSAFSSASLEPPLVLICVDHAASMHALLLTHPVFGVGESGVVLLEDAIAHLECRPIEHFEAGDHTVIVAAVERAEPKTGQPLLYYRGGYAQLER